MDPVTRGDPESPLRWTSKSTRKLADSPISPRRSRRVGSRAGDAEDDRGHRPPGSQRPIRVHQRSS
ncbi:MAG: hypothetical protein IPM79_24835 [Polyangiaceae bacterium]|nr:hypothetical protein [Polyangiaceae bacterium]